MRRLVPRLVPFLALAVASGCAEEPTECVSDERYFTEQVWGPFMGDTCFACHNAQGAARGTDLILVGPSQPDFAKKNLATIEQVAALERDGVSLLLLKPSQQIDHGGGKVIEKDGPEYQALQGLLERFENPVQCADGPGDGLDGLVLLDRQETLRKATLAIAGRLPTQEEMDAAARGDRELEIAVAALMEEDAFYERLKEMWNDLFLTDRYRRGNDATNLLDEEEFPNRDFHRELDETQVSPEYVELVDRFTNESVAREPLDLIAYVVKNDLPFTEVVAADYMVVNGYSAQVYGVDVDFEDPANPNELKPARLPGREHAGVLSSPMFLNRFPTTDTNRNRHRARMVYKFFLATDIMQLAERPVDPTSIVDFNPTMYNPSCTVCHENIDPVAGAFQNWDAEGRYRPPEGGWHPDMRPPGYKGETIPADEWPNSLAWLGKRIAQDPLFATAVVHNVHRGLTGQEPMLVPTDDAAADYQARLQAFQAQNAFFQDLADRFVADDYDLKTVVKGVLLGPYFRAKDADRDSTALADVGTARFLPPEQLHRKILAVTGFPWSYHWDHDRGWLLEEHAFLIFYGGIDSDSVTERITEPNGLMTSIARRMANEVSCLAVPQDFALSPEERRLFPLVERTFEPEDENGFAVAGSVEAIKKNIQHLHARVLGESLPLEDPEIERTYALFEETWREGKTLLSGDQIDHHLHWACAAYEDFWTGEELPEERRVAEDDRYTIRAWMAVLSYLLSDYAFLHE